jgi:DNA topoisomerase-1
MNIVVVESPAKCKTILKHLNSLKTKEKFTVIASYGHIRDLPKQKNAVDVSTFTPKYEINQDKIKQVKQLKEAVKDAKMVWIATDLDREGEGIGWHIVDLLRLQDHQYQRITFNEITKSAIDRAMKNPRKLDMNLVDAQQARRVVDRLYGYETTGVLWSAFLGKRSLISAGRVQSAVLKIITDKEREIEVHKSSNYWLLEGVFHWNLPMNIASTMLHEDFTGTCSTQFVKVSEAKEVLSTFTQHSWEVMDVTIKQRSTKPAKPFITSTLQQDAFTTLGFAIQHTMKVAQELYERGAITYMRTDSTLLSEDAMKMIQNYIQTTYGEEFFQNNNSHQTANKNAQEAHECIRVTNVLVRTLETATSDQQRVYTLIYHRTIASQMKPAMFQDICVHVRNQTQDPSPTSESLTFQSSLSHLIYPGWKLVYDATLTDKVVSEAFVEQTANLLCDCEASAKRIEAKHHWTQPQLRYTEASIVKTLEKEGIGRPSTYASILKKLLDKKYVDIQNVKGKDVDCVHLSRTFPVTNTEAIIEETRETKPLISESKKLVPTETGIIINKFMEDYFQPLIEKRFTNDMEQKLDMVAQGSKGYFEVLQAFYQNIETYLKRARVSIANEQKSSLKSTPVHTPSEANILVVDGVEYTIRKAKFGHVIQYQGNSAKTVYLSLEMYMKMTKKKIEDITAKDVKFLLQFPKRIRNGDGDEDEDVTIVLGPYGFYCKHKDKNIGLTPKDQNFILKEKFAIVEESLKERLFGDGDTYTYNGSSRARAKE